jgi:hypothetical protein
VKNSKDGGIFIILSLFWFSKRLLYFRELFFKLVPQVNP